MVDELYNTLYKELTRWCYAMTGNIQTAEDLVQEGFLRALTNNQLLKELSFPQQRAWLYRTIKNQYMDRLRHASFETIMEEVPEEAGEAAEYGQIDNELLLSGLTDEERVLFMLRYVEGYNATEIGEMFHLPPATVRTRLSTARRHLRQMLEGNCSFSKEKKVGGEKKEGESL